MGAEAYQRASVPVLLFRFLFVIIRCSVESKKMQDKIKNRAKKQIQKYKIQKYKD